MKFELIFDVASGLQALHYNDIVHNDIKSSNIVLFSSPKEKKQIIAKISDFGCSVLLASKATKSAAATLLFAPPEAYSSSYVVHPSRDIYSFGVLVLEIIGQRRPFMSSEGLGNLWEFKKNEAKMLQYTAQRIKESVNREGFDLL